MAVRDRRGWSRNSSDGVPNSVLSFDVGPGDGEAYVVTRSGCLQPCDHIRYPSMFFTTLDLAFIGIDGHW
jgi:hypothetical protein